MRGREQALSKVAAARFKITTSAFVEHVYLRATMPFSVALRVLQFAGHSAGLLIPPRPKRNSRAPWVDCKP
jgi:hypothetical protein